MANKRLIDANALWSDIMMLPHNGDMISSEEVEQTIKDATTVDAVEVVHGRWIINSDGYYPYCSRCKEEPKHGDMTNYCPNCGVKMDGGNEDG